MRSLSYWDGERSLTQIDVITEYGLNYSKAYHLALNTTGFISCCSLLLDLSSLHGGSGYNRIDFISKDVMKVIE